MSKSRLTLVHPAPTPQAPTRGKVVHDARGTAIWDWAVETGVLAKRTTADLITSLDVPGALSLELEPEAADGCAGGDPYNRPARQP